MDWIKKRLEQRDEIRQRREKITSATEPIWASLCEAVKDSIAAYFEALPYGRFEQDAAMKRKLAIVQSGRDLIAAHNA